MARRENTEQMYSIVTRMIMWMDILNQNNNRIYNVIICNLEVGNGLLAMDLDNLGLKR